jgi:hypothetical protein
MHLTIAAALALAAQTSPSTPSVPVASNLEYSMPADGGWTYSATSGGSEATFAKPGGVAQLTIRCTRSTRRIGLVKAASAASPTMWVWT